MSGIVMMIIAIVAVSYTHLDVYKRQGVLIELVKILVHLVTKGSMTAGVGDVANFIFGCTFAVPAGLIYRYKRCV